MLRKFVLACIVALVTTTASAMPMRQKSAVVSYLQPVSLTPALLHAGRSHVLPVFLQGSAPVKPPVKPPSGPTGSQMGMTLNEVSMSGYTNALKGVSAQGFNGNPMTIWDQNMYPIAAMTAVFGGESFNLWNGFEYKFKVAAGRSHGCKFNLSGAQISILSASNMTPTSGAGTTFTCNNSGLAGYVQFTCTNCSDITPLFDNKGSWTTGSGEFILCRDNNNGGPPNDDCSQYDLAVASNGRSGSFWTPEILTAYGSGPNGFAGCCIRPMGLILDGPNTSSNVGSWAYRAHIGDFSWSYNLGGSRVIPSTFASGSASPTHSFVLTAGTSGQAPYLYTASPSDDETNGTNGQSLGAWADGETIVGNPGTYTPGLIISDIVSDGSTNCGGGGCALMTVFTGQFRGSISGTTLTVTGMNNATTGQILVGDTITGAGVTTTTIVGSAATNRSACTPNCTGNGNTGTYAVATSQTVSANSTFKSVNTSGIAAGHILWVDLVQGTTEANGVREVSAVTATTITLNVHFVHASVRNSVASISTQALGVSGKDSTSYHFLVGPQENPIGVQAFPGVSAGSNNGLSTFVYDKATDKLSHGVCGGFCGMVPYEAWVNLAINLNKNIWYNIPLYANDDYYTQLAALLAANVPTNLTSLIEITNEPWNSGFSQQFYGIARRSWALRIAPNAFGDIPSYLGLRYAQASKLMTTTSFAGANRRRLEIAFMYQWAGGPNGPQSSGWNGQRLDPTHNQALCAYLGGTFTTICTGAPNYSKTVANGGSGIPMDWIDTVGYAPYSCGTVISAGPDCGGSYSSAYNSFFQSIINGWVTNDPKQQAAVISFIDDDMNGRFQLGQQIFTCSGTTITVPATIVGFTSAGFSLVSFQSTGSLPSGLDAKQVYRVSTVSNTGPFTITVRKFINGVIDTVDTNCGTGGSGTMTVGGLGYATPLAQPQAAVYPNASATSAFTGWQAAITPYNATRPAGMVQTKVRQYEGGMEATAYQAASYASAGVKPANVTITGTTHGTTTVDSVMVRGVPSVAGIGKGMVVSATDITGSRTVASINTGCTAPCFKLSAVAAGSNAGETIVVNDSGTGSSAAAIINDAINLGWKNSANARASIKNYYKGFVGTDPNQVTFGIMTNSTSPANLLMANGGTTSFRAGVNPWAVWPGPLNSSNPYQLFFGIQDYNNGL